MHDNLEIFFFKMNLHKKWDNENRKKAEGIFIYIEINLKHFFFFLFHFRHSIHFHAIKVNPFDVSVTECRFNIFKKKMSPIIKYSIAVNNDCIKHHCNIVDDLTKVLNLCKSKKK